MGNLKLNFSTKPCIRILSIELPPRWRWQRWTVGGCGGTSGGGCQPGPRRDRDKAGARHQRYVRLTALFLILIVTFSKCLILAQPRRLQHGWIIFLLSHTIRVILSSLIHYTHQIYCFMSIMLGLWSTLWEILLYSDANLRQILNARVQRLSRWEYWVH